MLRLRVPPGVDYSALDGCHNRSPLVPNVQKTTSYDEGCMNVLEGENNVNFAGNAAPHSSSMTAVIPETLAIPE